MSESEIRSHLEALPGYVSPIRNAALRYLDEGSKINTRAAFVGHRPWVAPENFAFSLFTGVTDEQLNDFSYRNGLEIPGAYRQFLNAMSGAFCFGISFFGITPGMLAGTNLVNRQESECHSLLSAAQYWRLDYDVPDELFHFGSRDYTEDSLVGYFMDESGRIVSVQQEGEQISEWTDFGAFLTEELAASEKLDFELRPKP